MVLQFELAHNCNSGQKCKEGKFNKEKVIRVEKETGLCPWCYRKNIEKQRRFDKRIDSKIWRAGQTDIRNHQKEKDKEREKSIAETKYTNVEDFF